jgi:ferredoxin-nitrite reductase
LGGEVGKGAHLGKCVMEKIPCESLQTVVHELLVQHFGATPKDSKQSSPTKQLVAAS